MSGRDLSGRWAGYYSQRGHKRPITAEIEQEGEHLVGRMSDELTAFETSVSEMAMEEGLPPGADERIVEQVRTLCPWALTEEVRAEVELPSDSVLEGEVQGDAVRFRKTYQGPFFTGYRVGDVRIGIAGEDQQVHYRGLISADGRVIEGQWLLPGVPENGLVRSEGVFVLRREPGRADEN